MKRIILFFFAMILLTSCGASRNRHNNRHKSYSDSSKSTAVLKKSKNTLEDFSAVIGVPVSKLKNKDLYAYINDWLGVPHRMGGTTKSGIDCSGFVGNLYRDVYRKNLPRTSRDMAAKTERKQEKNLSEGDLVFFSFGKKAIDHVGVYLHNNKFLHVSSRKGVIISDLKDSWYAKYYQKGGSIR